MIVSLSQLVIFFHQTANLCIPCRGFCYKSGLSAVGFLRVMNSGSIGRAWVENLCHRFSTFCSEADDIISQESVKFVRTQLITAGENLMHLCSQLVEDVLPEFSVDSAGENGLVFPAQEQDVNSLALEMLSIGMDTDQDGKSCTMNSASTLSSIVPVGETCTDIQSDGKGNHEMNICKDTPVVETLDFSQISVLTTSAQPPAAHSSEKMEESKNSFVEFQEYELPDDEVSCPSSGSTNAIQSNVCTQQFPITESDQPSCCQKLEESIIMVNSDECYSDSDMETNYLSLESQNTKVKFCTLKKKIADERSFESVSQGIYSETDRMTKRCCTELPCAKDSRMVDEEFCDWEII